MKVIDTSVLIKLFFPEEGSEKAKYILSHHAVVAPDLVLYEFSNYISRRADVTSEDMAFLLKQLYRLPIEFFVLPENRFIETAQLAKKLKVSSYDASFFILAKSLQAVFVTADQKFYQKVRQLGSIELL